jgi:sphingolipid 4-desaturase/C4-monooxygenase
MQTDFLQSELDQPHPSRTREILAKHPEIGTLMRRNPWTAAIIVFVFVFQTSMAIALSHYGAAWYITLLAAWCIGAFANHTIFVLIHEATHNLIFKNKNINRIFGILADLPNIVPTSIGFRNYHIKHHAHQGDHDLDADMASDWEARLVGNSAIGKALWLLMFPAFQLVRPPRLNIDLWNGWVPVNILASVLYTATMVYFFGGIAIVYLIGSFWFSVGLHPLGGRWIQEHFLVEGEQETYSYYGPLNFLALNVGYHNEHHDFPAVPWSNLPKIREMAPEYYNNLKYHTSWTKLWLQFIFDSKLSLYSRAERTVEGKMLATNA